MYLLRERVICSIKEFDLNDDGEKICPYHSAYLTESIIMCVYNTRMQFTFPQIFSWECEVGGTPYFSKMLNFRIPRNFGPPHLHVSGGFEDRGITQ